ncbi:hypothetical protein K458DRAFT_463605 [Lentithecium fluviatile CBS 122367]|uniref:Uncharacterized protein n=1 Tax=Lentithecium fluviatile CBS 122367 TaxID=1168545 RepID=A0A6G1IJL4_9PLEO|nr:hypothetical protein K458DRAFT_463605 [Lentithecium fluviatile CBS 122367]
MHYLSLILGLTAAASAIDVRIHFKADCTGASYECLGLQPNICCYAESGVYPTIGFYGVPPSWNIETRGYSRSGDNRCGNQRALENLSGGNFKCLRQGSFTGAGYGFRGKKRDVGGCDAEGEAEGQTCTSSRKADVLVLEDGVKYSLQGMEDKMIGELVGLAVNGTTGGDVPEVFQEFEMRE